MGMPDFVHLIEVGPRDGIQNEPTPIATQDKIAFIDQLSQTGLQTIEATSFVSSQQIPQLSDADEVFKHIKKEKNIAYRVLIPNEKGLALALQAQAKAISVITACSDTFSKKNAHCSIKESVKRIKHILTATKPLKLHVRAYISCVFGCPYEGQIPYQKSLELIQQLLDLGCDEISIGDTIGVAHAKAVKNFLTHLKTSFGLDRFALHFHNTYGQALTNIYVALELGFHRIDSSIAGLGGCPYAPGAAGNVATEDVLYLLNGLGIKTGVNMDALIKVSHFVSKLLGHKPRSSVALANL